MTLDLRNQKFSYLTVLHKAGRIFESSVWRTLWLCKCICGKEKQYRTHELRSGKIRTCGCCEWHIHHNEAYVSWMSMKQRCNYTENKDYKYYGGRGIKYDPRWEAFVEFYLDMGDPPYYKGERMSLDRINNDLNYSKENCRWATRSEQQFNKGKVNDGSLT